MVGARVSDELQKTIDDYRKKGGKVSGTKKKRKIPLTVNSIDDLKNAELWTSDEYGDYYKGLNNFYKGWYGVKEGDRTVVIGQNLASYLEDKNVRRKCWCSRCLVPGVNFGKDRRGEKHIVLDRNGTTLEMCWRCEYVCGIPIEGIEEKLSDPMASGFNIYADFGVKNLINWDAIGEDRLRSVRTLYWRPAIRDIQFRNATTTGNWSQVVAYNPVIDIDVRDKNIRNVLDYWDESIGMLGDVVLVMENEGLEFKMMFSGNGWYLILKRVVMNDKLKEKGLDGVSPEVFWNKVAKGLSMWIKKYLVDTVGEKWSKYFNIEFKQPNELKYYKSPFSIHQRFYHSAIPVDMNLLMKGKDEFVENINPKSIPANFDKLIRIWGM